MEWTRFFVESFVEIVQYIAWPAVVLIIFVFLRKPMLGAIESLVGRLYKVRLSKGSEFVFYLPDKDKIASIGRTAEANLTWNDYLDALELLTSLSGTFALSLQRISSSENLKEDVIAIRESAEKAGMLEMLENTFSITLSKVKENRADSPHLKVYQEFQERLKAEKERQKGAYRPLAEILQERNGKK